MQEPQEHNLYYKTQSYTIKDFYKSYNTYVKENDLKEIDYRKFRSVLEDYFMYIRDAILNHGRIITLPSRFGKISVRKYKGNPNQLQYDYQNSKKYGKPVWYFNDHSDGYRYRFHWDKRNLQVENCTKYQMVFTRENKRNLAKIIKNNERDYIGL